MKGSAHEKGAKGPACWFLAGTFSTVVKYFMRTVHNPLEDELNKWKEKEEDKI